MATDGRILVTGGTGRLGRVLVPRCLRSGRPVRVLSRRPPPRRETPVEWARGDLATGRGIRAALADVDVVVHLASLPYRARTTTRVDVEGTHRLVRAAARVGVTHVLYTSIVGVDEIPWPYFRK